MSRIKNRKSISPRLLLHKWRIRDRLILSLLDLQYQNHPKDFTSIFNHIRKDVLMSEGFNKGIPSTRIVCQLHEYRNGGTGSAYYDHLAAFPRDELHETFEHTFEQISSAAQDLRIDLIPKLSQGQEHTSLGQCPRPRPRPPRIRVLEQPTLITETTSVSSWNANSSDTDLEICFQTPKQTQTPRGTRFRVPAVQRPTPGFLSIKIYNDDLGTSFYRRPRLLFRGFETRYGLVARRFICDKDITQPPAFSTQDFKRQARPHLCRNKNYSSPFLSFAQNPTVALNHVFNKVADEGKDMSLAIFRYDDIHHDAQRKFGKESGVYLCSTIVNQHWPMNLPRSHNGKEYEGYGEFLVWGAVNCKPVAIIKQDKALMIRAIMKNMRELNFEEGTRLSKYLPQHIENEYLELFLLLLVRRFRVPGHEKSRKNTNYFNFIKGAMSGAEHIQAAPDPVSDGSDFVIESLSGIHTYAAMADWRSSSEEPL